MDVQFVFIRVRSDTKQSVYSDIEIQNDHMQHTCHLTANVFYFKRMKR